MSPAVLYHEVESQVRRYIVKSLEPLKARNDIFEKYMVENERSKGELKHIVDEALHNVKR